ncbi:hypothetical protein CAEBREN_05045 [Caenorhabditis brenneri]|uniref:C2H2-type domain-containing protein n=1 Tax=Caenorhabditis brenneri TaxID=135651 RepID=G0M881_CAEBE|nr:hypothetical protein CAEBREN_05045 [Caenorhabditis brenneri]
MFGRVKNFLSKLVPSFSRNEAPPPTDHDDAGPGPDSKKHTIYKCRVCRKTIKLASRDGKQKAIDHALGHGNMFFYNCRVHGCGAKRRTCHQIKYHHRKSHTTKKDSKNKTKKNISGYSLGSLPLNDPALRAIVKKSFGRKIMRRLCTDFTQKTKSEDKLLVVEMNELSLE